MYRSSGVRRLVIPALCAVLVLGAVPGLSARGQSESPIVIHDAWVRETPGDATSSAAYFVIENRGDVADALIEASTPLAGVVELHTMEHQGGVMRMRRVFAIDIAAGDSTVLEQGGLHVMLMQLQQPLQAGATLPLTLLFDSAGQMTIDVEVRPARSGGRHGRN